MRVVITGATGNVGTSVLAALAGEPEVKEIVAVARRPATFGDGRVQMVAADVAHADLEPILVGADAVVHLAWLIQPSRDERTLRATNVDGSRRVFDAAVRAGVGTIVHASSVGAYGPGPKDRGVDESWPTTGIPTLFYSRHKVEVERLLDRWIDLALGVPLMDTGRARRELGWEPVTSATDALLELLDGIREGAGFPTPPLAAGSAGPLRLGELRSGVGAKT